MARLGASRRSGAATAPPAGRLRRPARRRAGAPSRGGRSLRSRPRRRHGRPRHRLRAGRLSSLGHGEEPSRHRRGPALRQVPGATAGARRSPGRRDDRHRPDDRRRHRGANPVARRRPVASWQAGRTARLGPSARWECRLGVGERGRRRRALDRAAERSAVRPGHGLPVSPRPPQGVARSSGRSVRVVGHAGCAECAWTMRRSSRRPDRLPVLSLLISRVRYSGARCAPGTPVAIAVNGRVAATTRTFGSSGSRFSVLVPEGVLVDGKNSVNVYTVRDVAGTNQFARLEGASAEPGRPGRQDGGAR